MRPRTVRGDGHTGGMAGAAARTRRVGAMSGGPERRADLQAQPAARSAAWPGGEISSSAMVSRGGGHSRSMPQAVDRFAADADGADIFGIGAWPIAGASQAHRAAAASPLREAADAPRRSPPACLTTRYETRSVGKEGVRT